MAEHEAVRKVGMIMKVSLAAIVTASLLLLNTMALVLCWLRLLH